MNDYWAVWNIVRKNACLPGVRGAFYLEHLVHAVAIAVVRFAVRIAYFNAIVVNHLRIDKLCRCTVCRGNCSRCRRECYTSRTPVPRAYSAVHTVVFHQSADTHIVIAFYVRCGKCCCSFCRAYGCSASHVHACKPVIVTVHAACRTVSSVECALVGKTCIWRDRKSTRLNCSHEI